MKKFLNSLLCLLLSLTLVLSFAACSKDKDENSDDEETSKSDTVKDENKEDEEDKQKEEKDKKEDEEEQKEVKSTDLEYYEGTTIPTYTSVTGVALKEKDEELGDFYVYDYTNNDDVKKYWDAMLDAGFEIYETDEEDNENTVTLTFFKNDEMVMVSTKFEFEQVWVIVS